MTVDRVMSERATFSVEKKEPVRSFHNVTYSYKIIHLPAGGISEFPMLRRYTRLVILESGRLEQAMSKLVYSLFSKTPSGVLNPIVAEAPHSNKMQS